MNTRYFTSTGESSETLKGCVSGLATAGALVLFLLLSWLGILRSEIYLANRDRKIAESERDAAIAQRDAAVLACNDQLAKAETARQAAENQAQLALGAKDKAEGQRDQDERELSFVRAARAVPAEAVPAAGGSDPSIPQAQPVIPSTPSTVSPSAADITNFVRDHLSRMAGPVEAELGDYAEEVEFHDKPHASLQMIEAERESWAQKWPRRIIQLSGAMPEVVFRKDTSYGWQAIVVFDWQWIFWNRFGGVARGVYRDTWRIVPSGNQMKIIAEHSVDASTGRTRD